MCDASGDLGDRRLHRFIQVRCSPFHKVLFKLCIFFFGSIPELSELHTLVTEKFCLVHHAVIPELNLNREFNDFTARVWNLTLEIGEGAGANRPLQRILAAILSHSAIHLFTYTELRLPF